MDYSNLSELEISEEAQDTPTKRNVFSVSELNRKIKFLLESEFRNIWVEGEISNFKHHSSGHMYFSLKDEKSQVNVVFFSRQNRSLKFKLKDGLKVVLFGRISVYEPRGNYQVYVDRVEPKGMGALQLAFLQLKAKLEKEGLFSAEYKKPIPRFPKKVGVITSPTGAAIRDILNVINRRFQGTSVLLYPAKVQGDGAAEEVATGIEVMNARKDIDVLIVGRGGGSLEDLWAFNEEVVARSVFASKIPVISAVGHEIDWSICDLVADLRAPTPSAAAELVVQNRAELVTKVDDIKSRLKNAIFNFVDSKRDELESLRDSYAFKQPKALIENYAQRLDEMKRQLQNYTKTLIQHKQQAFKANLLHLEALSPLKILSRGYSVTFNAKGHLLKKATNIKTGEEIKTRLESGVVVSVVKSIDEKDGE